MRGSLEVDVLRKVTGFVCLPPNIASLETRTPCLPMPWQLPVSGRLGQRVAAELRTEFEVASASTLCTPRAVFDQQRLQDKLLPIPRARAGALCSQGWASPVSECETLLTKHTTDPTPEAAKNPRI